MRVESRKERKEISLPRKGSGRYTVGGRKLVGFWGECLGKIGAVVLRHNQTINVS